MWLFKGPKSRTPSADEIGDRNAHSLLEEMQIGTATSGDGLTASYRTKHTLTI